MTGGTGVADSGMGTAGMAGTADTADYVEKGLAGNDRRSCANSVDSILRGATLHHSSPTLPAEFLRILGHQFLPKQTKKRLRRLSSD